MVSFFIRRLGIGIWPGLAGLCMVRAPHKNNHVFSKGPFCFECLRIGVSCGHPFRERTEGAYERDEDVRGKIGGLSRPLFVSRGFPSSCPRRLVLINAFLWPYPSCIDMGEPLHLRALPPFRLDIE